MLEKFLKCEWLFWWRLLSVVNEWRTLISPEPLIIQGVPLCCDRRDIKERQLANIIMKRYSKKIISFSRIIWQMITRLARTHSHLKSTSQLVHELFISNHLPDTWLQELFKLSAKRFPFTFLAILAHSFLKHRKDWHNISYEYGEGVSVSAYCEYGFTHSQPHTWFLPNCSNR